MGLTHPAIIARTSVVDHVTPGTQGGSWTDFDNMVTACWPCNAVKADLTHQGHLALEHAP